MDENNIRKEVILLRNQFQKETKITFTNNVFLQTLPLYCDWFEEQLIIEKNKNNQR